MASYTCLVVVVVCYSIYCRASYQGSGDAAISGMVVDFQEMCPYVDLCYSNRTQNVTYGSRLHFEYQPCCSPCKCEDDCDSYECCPDKLESAMTYQEFDSVMNSLVDCVYPQFRAYHSDKFNSPRPYRYISRCPTGYTNVTTKEKCMRTISEFDFREPLNYIVPITSVSLHVNYMNYYCWLCNGDLDDTLEPWEPAMVCEVGYTRGMLRSAEEIRELVDKDKHCNLMFIAPSNMSAYIKPCLKLISQCNETGLWSTYDRSLEEACLSYTSAYNTSYKNVHCFLCNGHDRTDNEELCKSPDVKATRPSFVALLDFNNLEQDSTGANRNSNCQPQEHYDQLTVSYFLNR